jgi:hypothetical protein
MTNVRFSRGSMLLRATVLALGALAAGQALHRGMPRLHGPEPASTTSTATSRSGPKGRHASKVENVTLTDQFETATVTVTKVRHLCLPPTRAKKARGPDDAPPQLQHPAPGTPTHQSGTSASELAPIRVDTIRPTCCRYRPAESRPAGAPAADPNMHGRPLRLPGGPPGRSPRWTGRSRCRISSPELYTLRRVRHLCLPVNKNGEGIRTPTSTCSVTAGIAPG